MTTNAPQPILTFTWTMSYPDEINESLNVYSDGSVWYWSLKPAQIALHNRVGTFNFQLPDHEFEDLKKLASDLAAVESVLEEPARNTLAISVITYANGKTQTHLLSASATDADNATFSSPALERAYNIGQDLARRAEDAPLAVVRLSWKPGSAGIKAGRAANVIFQFENIGIKPVLLKVGYEEYALYDVKANGNSTQLWQGAELMGTGIQSDDSDSGGPPSDGIYTPAEIAPGTTSTAVFRDALLFDQPRTMKIGAAVIGKINIYYPSNAGPQSAPDPEWPFSLETRPRQVAAQ